LILAPVIFNWCRFANFFAHESLPVKFSRAFFSFGSRIGWTR
jgi:hypothetical protein